MRVLSVGLDVLTAAKQVGEMASVAVCLHESVRRKATTC